MRAIALCFLTLFSLDSSLSLASSRDEALSEDQKVLHLLSRITFGARPGDLERVKAMGWRTFLEEQLEPSGRDPSGVARLANLNFKDDSEGTGGHIFTASVRSAFARETPVGG